MNTEKNNEFKNKSNETLEKCSQRVYSILKDTNWNVEYVYPTYKGVILRICLNGKKKYGVGFSLEGANQIRKRVIHDKRKNRRLI